MNTEIRSQIFTALKDLSLLDTPTHETQNMLYGFFDDYDYSTEILDSAELRTIRQENPQLASLITNICYDLKDYGK